jgi:glycosyltransferase involved in cell wall biosynthesis
MRIGIDVRYLSHGLMGGVHTSIAHFIPALVELASDHQLYLYADTKRPFELAPLPDHVTVRYLPWHSPLSSVYHDFFMRRQMAHDQIDVAHFPANYGFGPSGARTVITLNDALNIHPLRSIIRGLADSNSKNLRGISMMTYLHFCTRLALRHAHLVLTISQYSRSEIAHYSEFDPERIVPVPLAISSDLQRIDDPEQLAAVRQRHHLTRPFVLADALKNPIVIVKAWKQLPADLRERYQIVFFCRRPDPLPIIREAEKKGYARLLIRPPWEDLVALYSMTEAFLFPSWIEGFGIPVLEAMTCGAPVIASDRGSIPEVAGDAALLSDADDAEAMARNIERVLTSPSQAQQMRESGFARAAQFSWRKTAQHTLKAYRQAVELPKAHS